MCSTTRRPSPSGRRMSVRHRSNGSLSSSPHRLARPIRRATVSSPMRDSVSSSSSSRSGSSSTTRTSRLAADLLTGSCAFLRCDFSIGVRPAWPGVNARFNVIRKCAPGPLGSNSSAAPLASANSRAMYSPRPVPPGRVVKNGSKICAAQLRGNARAVVVQLADHRVAHVAGAARRCGCCLPSSGSAARRCARGSTRSGSGARGRR